MGTEPGSPQWGPVTGLEATGINKTRRFPLNIRKCYFSSEGDQTLHRLARGIVKFLSVEIFKKSFGHIPSSRQPCLSRGVGSDGLQRSLPNSPFCDSTRYQKNSQCQCILATSLAFEVYDIVGWGFLCAFGQILSQTSPNSDSLHSLQSKVSVNMFHKAILLQCLTNFF